MYSLQTAFLKAKGSFGAPREVDVSALSVTKVLDQYEEGHFVFTHPSLPDPIYTPIVLLRTSKLPLKSLSFNLWLGTLGSLALPFVEDEPVYVGNGFVRYVDAWSTAINLHRISAYNEDIGNPMLSETPDAFFKPLTGAHDDVNRHCCFIVGGLGHYSEPATHGTRIKDASRTLDKSNDNLIGLLNFKDLGEIALKRILPVDVFKSAEASLLYQSCLIHTGLDLSEKSLMIFIAGLLHGEHDVLTVVNRKEGIVSLDFQKLDLNVALSIAKRTIDLTGMDIFDDRETSNISADKLKSNEGILSVLTMSQTFLVCVDVPSYSVRYQIPEQSCKNGKVSFPDTVSRVSHPLVDRYGRFKNFLIKHEPFSKACIYKLTDDKALGFEDDHLTSNDLLDEKGGTAERAFGWVRQMQIQG